jgi:hypothetical protein
MIGLHTEGDWHLCLQVPVVSMVSQLKISHAAAQVRCLADAGDKVRETGVQESFLDLISEVTW